MDPALVAMLLSAFSTVGGALSNKGTQTQTTTPTLDPAMQSLQNQLTQIVQGRLSAPSALPQGYETGGIKQINSLYDVVNQNVQNSLTARGLASSPVAASSDVIMQGKRAGDISNFVTSLPQVERQFRDADLAAAGGLINTGRGSTTTGNVSSGGGAGDAFSNLAGMLGYLYAQGSFGGQKTPYTLPGYGLSPR